MVTPGRGERAAGAPAGRGGKRRELIYDEEAEKVLREHWLEIVKPVARTDDAVARYLAEVKSYDISVYGRDSEAPTIYVTMPRQGEILTISTPIVSRRNQYTPSWA